MNLKKLAIVLSRFPYPLEKGDKLRAYHQLKYLSNFFCIELFILETNAISEANIAQISPFCKQLHIYHLTSFDRMQGVWSSLLHNEPIQVGYFYAEKVFNRINSDLDAFQPDVIYAQLSRTTNYVRHRKEYKVCDFQDAFSLNYQRLSKYSWIPKKWFYLRESECMKHFEQLMMKCFDNWTIISEMDRLAISPRIHIVSNGVDSTKFSPKQTQKKYDVLFIGNLTYAPNQQAVRFLISTMLPALITLKPDIRVAIAGANMSVTIQNKQSKNLICLGWVDDIVALYNEASVFVAPLFSGAGLQNKVLEAMSCEVPVVCTTVVNASLQATNKEVLIANNAQEFAEKVLELLSDKEEYTRMTKLSRNFILKHYQWQIENEKLKQILSGVNQL